MSEFFHKLVKGNTIAPPEQVREALLKNFSNPVNVEWYTREKYYEAIFYEDKRENIARFDPDGSMLGYKSNLHIESLPEGIMKSARARGEIMNAVAIHSGKKIGYEIIYRNKKLQRFLMLIRQDGMIEFEKPL